RGCAPKNEPKKNLSLEIQSVEVQPQATRVKIVVSALVEPVDFDFPVYRLSSGRWLINETGRAYLIDPECREYRLKDRKAIDGFQIPLYGRIKLKPEQPFEAILVFPRISEQARVGMLVYDGQTLPFMLGVEGRGIK